jgi:galactokinase/CTP:molybdopterin cytidylyltransferase MocA
VRGASTLAAYPQFGFDLAEGPAGDGGEGTERAWVSYLYARPAPAPHWANYVKGAVYYARLKYGDQLRRGFDFLVDSGIPPSGGASSSSALIVLAGAGVRAANGIKFAARELAHESAQAEWYVGTRGGAMDHLTICLARRRHAVHISYADGRAEEVPLPGGRFRWATFFSHAADKGRAVMLEYNERAAVARIIIPALVEGWAQSLPEAYAAWRNCLAEYEAGSVAALEGLGSVLQKLPETLSLAELQRDYPRAFAECSRSFPALVGDRHERPLRVRERALHHLGEVRRVAAATRMLRDASPQSARCGQALEAATMRAVGALLDESHESLCALYGVCTPEVNELAETIAADPQVYGVRLMGGGFGGNVLALTTEENLNALLGRVQSGYYGPRGRDARAEGSVMVSTPGDGLSALDPARVWREALTQFGMNWWAADRYRPAVCALLDELSADVADTNVWPVIVAAGKGTRAAASGLDVPKPLAPVSGVPAIKRVLRALRAALGEAARAPVVIVSPETEARARAALKGEDVVFVTQPEARGTGDAVLCAYEQMREFEGRALVVWGTQPVIRARTIRRTLALAQMFDDHQMIVPTAVAREPYAPLLRDHLGRVRAGEETHLEGARPPRFGETNIGLFVVSSAAMFKTLSELRRRYWRADGARYERPGGELGFPNELITSLAGGPAGVFAAPIADLRERQGIKSRADIARCERFIRELEAE